MKKVKLIDYSKQIKKPLRTLRLHASQGKLKAEKIDGQWYVLLKDDETNDSGSKDGKQSSETDNATRKKKNNKKGSKKYTSLKTLGVYQELLEYIKKIESFFLKIYQVA